MQNDRTPPTVLDYASPSNITDRTHRGKYIAGGIGFGLLVSLFAWPGMAIAASKLAIDFNLPAFAAVIIAIKVTSGWLIDRKLPRSGFVAGVVLSMPLVAAGAFGMLMILFANFHCC